MALSKQMELFENGGLKDEGGMVDEVSGNDVPLGSTREEVRDDIPAQLSEGEFVFPADVVRFIGLEKLMRLRQQAKQGLKQMEAMGQMGNSDEATMPDDLPFDETDLDIEDDLEYNVGGYVQAQQGAYIPNVYQPQNAPVNFATPGEARITTGVLGKNEMGQPYAPTKETKPYAPLNFSKFLGSSSYGAPQTFNKKYIGPNGEIRYIPHDVISGLPLYPIDNLLAAGYKLEIEKKKEEEEELIKKIKEVINEGSDGPDDGPSGDPSGSPADDEGPGGISAQETLDTSNIDVSGIASGVSGIGGPTGPGTSGPGGTATTGVDGDSPDTGVDGTGMGAGGEDAIYKGSLITKRKASGKVKPKYMKRGGLASKK